VREREREREDDLDDGERKKREFLGVDEDRCKGVWQSLCPFLFLSLTVCG
jgi:hypothetical protein